MSLLENLSRRLDSNISVRRYNLSDMISESYSTLYGCEEGTNLHKLAESHLQDLKNNPTDTERLSKNLSILKEVSKLVESGQISDRDLVERKKKPTPPRRPKGRRVSESRRSRGQKLKESISKSEQDKILAIFSKTSQDVLDSSTEYEDGNEVFRVSCDNSNPTYIGWLEDDLRQLEDSFDIGYEREENDNGFYGRDYIFYKYTDFNESKSSIKDTNNEELDEVEDPELTEEELDELTKHLADIRKNKGTSQQKESMDESIEDFDDNKGKVPLTDVKDEVEGKEDRVILKPSYESRRSKGKRLKESDSTDRRVWQLGVDIFCPENKMNAVKDAVKDAVISVGPECSVSGIEWSDTSWSPEEYGYNLSESRNRRGKRLKESKKVDKSYSHIKEGLSEFGRASSGKAFYKTLKKMHESLKSGEALTRQDSINLYKASNSALTQLSIELEHNPKFINTFTECTDLLATDVLDVLRALRENKAPSKKTMKSLAKFTESLLDESSYVEEWGSKMLRDYGEAILDRYYDYEEPSDISDFATQVVEKAMKNSEYKGFSGFDDEMAVEFESLVKDYLDNFDYSSVDESKKVNESYSISDIKKIAKEVGYEGEVNDEFVNDMQGNSIEEIKRAMEVLKKDFSHNMNESEDGEERLEIKNAIYHTNIKDPSDDYEEDLKKYDGKKCTVYHEGEGRYAATFEDGSEYDVTEDELKFINESEDEDEEAEDVESPEVEDEESTEEEVPDIDTDDDFVGDDEGDMMSEEAEAFYQEYADARKEILDDLKDKYEDSEDPQVQDMLAKETEEVSAITGEDEEESEETEGDPEENPEDSDAEDIEDPEVEEEPTEDDSDITDDELEELKKHLEEMRAARRK